MKIDVEESKIYSYTDPASDLYMCGALNIGKKGYFSDHADFSDVVEGVLNRITIEPEYNANTYYPFKIDDSLVGFKFFCPEECAVEKEEPEFCPYKTLDELPFKVGDSVTFREKNEHEKELMLTCTGIVARDESELSCVHLGAYIFELDDLLEEYELFNGKEWVPFGVEA